jgi:endonuclease YncB( thermonuclease family)
MDRHEPSKRALQRGALFVLRFPLLLCVIALSPTTGQGSECPADRIDEEVTVAFVYDGDTVRLEDGRKIRLAGINAPEVARRDKAGEPLADEARAHLSQLLDSSRHVRVRYEQERRDRYGRLLAHLYLPDGSSIEERLLGEGLAQQLVVPPNRWQSSCYQRIEQRARQQRRGVWRLDYYQPLRANPAHSSDGRFRVIGGTVVRVAESRKSLWLSLDTGMAVRIARRDLHYFTDTDLHGLKGQSVVARGWLSYDGQRYQTTVRHPSALMKVSDWN